MTVKEIFELRKQGKIEEAYNAIRPLYAAHKGKYTTLCMFWTAADIFKLRLDQGKVDEARKIFEALKRVLPYIKNNEVRPEDNAIPALGIDKDTRSTAETAAGFIQYASRRLAKATPKEDSNNPNNSCSKESTEESNKCFTDSHLAVSLDEGIIRPMTGINAPQRVILACLVAHPGYDIPQISESTGISQSSVERHIAVLTDRNLINISNSANSGYYVS